MKKVTMKKVTATVLAGALTATSFGIGNIAMAARNNNGYNGQDAYVITGSAIGGKVTTGVAVSARPEKNPIRDTVCGGAVPAKPEKNPNRDTVSGGAVTAEPEKEPNKDIVNEGDVTAEPEKDPSKDTVNEGDVTTKTPNETTKPAATTKPATNTKKVKVKKAKKTAKNKIKVTLTGTNVWKNVKVSVKTSSGKTVKAKIVKKTKNYCVIKTTKKLEKKTYVIKIKGVKVKGASSYETITTKVKVK